MVFSFASHHEMSLQRLWGFFFNSFFFFFWVLVVAHRQAACHVGSQLPAQVGTHIPCIERRILNHWTTRGRPQSLSFVSSVSNSCCFLNLRFLTFPEVWKNVKSFYLQVLLLCHSVLCNFHETLGWTSSFYFSSLSPFLWSLEFLLMSFFHTQFHAYKSSVFNMHFNSSEYFLQVIYYNSNSRSVGFQFGKLIKVLELHGGDGCTCY